MSSQKLRRLSGGRYAIVDDELVIVGTETTCMTSTELVGVAFLTRSSGWRLLRRGLVDIGYSPIPELAIERLLADAASQPKADLPAATKKALPI